MIKRLLGTAPAVVGVRVMIAPQAALAQALENSQAATAGSVEEIVVTARQQDRLHQSFWEPTCALRTG